MRQAYDYWQDQPGNSCDLIQSITIPHCLLTTHSLFPRVMESTPTHIQFPHSLVQLCIQCISAYSHHPQPWSETIRSTQQDPGGLKLFRDQPALPPGGYNPPVPKRLGPPTGAPALLHRSGSKSWWFEAGLKTDSHNKANF